MFLHLLLGAALAASLSPDEAVTAALAVNPDVARAEADLSAARGSSRQTALLRENPEVEGSYSLAGDRIEGSVGQPLSLTGEGLADHRSARARVAAAEAAAQRARLTIAAETRSAYVDAVVKHRIAALSRAAFELASRQLTATEARVAAGEASDLDLRLARLEQAKAARELLGARAAEAQALAALSTLVRRAVAGEDLASDPIDAAPEPRRPPPEERSDVRAARLAVDAAEAALARERAAVLPPVTLGGFYESDGGGVAAGPSLGVTLPLWHQNQAGVGEAKGQAAVARAELVAASARAEAEVRTAADANADAAETMASVPATDEDARAALASIEAGSRSGELDLVTTILLRGEVVSGQQALSQARGDLALARITLLLATEDDALLGGASR
ncbi:MAG: TolC family protein [Myxococcota bacterium]